MRTLDVVSITIPKSFILEVSDPREFGHAKWFYERAGLSVSIKELESNSLEKLFSARFEIMT